MLQQVGKRRSMTNKWGLTSTPWAPAHSENVAQKAQDTGDPSQLAVMMMKIQRW